VFAGVGGGVEEEGDGEFLRQRHREYKGNTEKRERGIFDRINRIEMMGIELRRVLPVLCADFF
jgi:hypothetical protein